MSNDDLKLTYRYLCEYRIMLMAKYGTDRADDVAFKDLNGLIDKLYKFEKENIDEAKG